MTRKILLLASFAFLAGCGSDAPRSAFTGRTDADKSVTPVEIQKPVPGCCKGRAFVSHATGYYPHNNRMQGGYVDRRGKPLHTLQDYLDGKSGWVSIAMDATVAPYGTKLCIPEIEDTYGRAIEFRLVDTGGAFKNKKQTRLDVCSRDRASAHLASVNRKVTVVLCAP